MAKKSKPKYAWTDESGEYSDIKAWKQSVSAFIKALGQSAPTIGDTIKKIDERNERLRGRRKR